MGFYAPAQIVRDARDHGVEVLPADINFSTWDYGLERSVSGEISTLDHGHEGLLQGKPSQIIAQSNESLQSNPKIHPRHAEMRDDIMGDKALRLGFRQIKGLKQDDMDRLVARRGAGLRFGARSVAQGGALHCRARGSGRGGCLPLDRPRPARGALGRARPQSGRRQGRPAALRPRSGPGLRARCRASAHAARRACGRGLPAPVALAQGPPRLLCPARSRAPAYAAQHGARSGRRWPARHRGGAGAGPATAGFGQRHDLPDDRGRDRRRQRHRLARGVRAGARSR